MSPQIAVLIPCLNEERSIATVVSDFASALPGAPIYVYDNNSTDRSVELASKAGAITAFETCQGKGHVVRRMFLDVDADIYVLVDGDNTYDAGAAVRMIEALTAEDLDMVVARRIVEGQDVWRRGHRIGNHFFTHAISLFFGRKLKDVLSGYRVFSRRFVQSFAGIAEGFEIEAELTVHALTRGMRMRELDAPYRGRGAGSESKLETWTDGFRILRFIAREYYASIGRTTSPATSVNRKSRP